MGSIHDIVPAVLLNLPIACVCWAPVGGMRVCAGHRRACACAGEREGDTARGRATTPYGGAGEGEREWDLLVLLLCLLLRRVCPLGRELLQSLRL